MASRNEAGRINQAIANAVVRERKRAFGRGPVKAQAFFRHNVVVVVMDDSLTEAERALAARGCPEEVMRMRSYCEDTMRDRLVDDVEAATGCKVVAFMSGHHIAPDMAAHMFVLDRDVPLPPDGAATASEASSQAMTRLVHDVSRRAKAARERRQVGDPTAWLPDSPSRR